MTLMSPEGTKLGTPNSKLGENISNQGGNAAFDRRIANFESRISSFESYGISRRTSALFALLGVLGALVVSVAIRAQAQNSRPQLLRDVGIDQKLNDPIPLDLSFRDETGETVLLRRYFNGQPLILALVYYQCPMLCTEVLNGLLHSLQAISMDAGREFNVVIVSIDPRETPSLAAMKKRVYAGLYGRPQATGGWHFLTGDEASIQNLAHAVGFRYAYDSESGQFAHPSAIMVLTPEGKLSRYFYGIQYPPRDMRLGLVEASRGKIGTRVDQILLYCYHYDPRTGKYGLMVFNVIRAASLVTVAALGVFLTVLFRRERSASTRAAVKAGFRSRST